MDAGRLRHRLILQDQVETQHPDTGEMLVEWTDPDVAPKVWAAIEPLSARDFVTAQTEKSKVVARIIIRYRPGITAKMRLYHPAKGVYYYIEGDLADKDSGLEYLTLPVSSGVR